MDEEGNRRDLIIGSSSGEALPRESTPGLRSLAVASNRMNMSGWLVNIDYLGPFSNGRCVRRWMFMEGR